PPPLRCNAAPDAVILGTTAANPRVECRSYLNLAETRRGGRNSCNSSEQKATNGTKCVMIVGTDQISCASLPRLPDRGCTLFHHMTPGRKLRTQQQGVGKF